MTISRSYGQAHEEEGNTKVDHHLHYALDNHCVPYGERKQLIREGKTSKVVGHFGVGIIVSNL